MRGSFAAGLVSVCALSGCLGGDYRFDHAEGDAAADGVASQRDVTPRDARSPIDARVLADGGPDDARLPPLESGLPDRSDASADAVTPDAALSDVRRDPAEAGPSDARPDAPDGPLPDALPPPPDVPLADAVPDRPDVHLPDALPPPPDVPLADVHVPDVATSPVDAAEAPVDAAALPADAAASHIDAHVPVVPRCDAGSLCVECLGGEQSAPCNGCPAGTIVPSGWVCIPAGRFEMGAGPDEVGSVGSALPDRPRHTVHVTRPYLMQAKEVTQGDWLSLMGSTPAFFRGAADAARLPVEGVDWYEAAKYANILSKREGLPPCYPIENEDRVEGLGWGCPEVVVDGSCDPQTAYRFTPPPPVDPACLGYRLPTEAEWERAARAGSDEATLQGPLVPPLDCTADFPSAWFCGNALRAGPPCANHIGGPACIGPQPVGQLRPNAWGLFDMAGNVFEWVGDAVDREGEGSNYPVEAVSDPTGFARPPGAPNAYFGVRGGGWSHGPGELRFSDREWGNALDRYGFFGFRLVRSVPLAVDGPLERCDAQDNDGDGLVDEDFGLHQPCVAGLGACAAAGETLCAQDRQGTVCSASAGASEAERCDGIDNDCDGTIDEDVPPTVCGVGACQRASNCVDGRQTACVPGTPAPDDLVLNGSDDDCDGQTDEDMEWVSVPGGSFVMQADREFPHEVHVPDFKLARAEATNAQYQRCHDAGVCPLPHYDDGVCWTLEPGQVAGGGTVAAPFRAADHPVVCITRAEAATFAGWVGGRLPSEAEWEYAAAGGDAHNRYPWGSAEPDCSQANTDGCTPGNMTSLPTCSTLPQGAFCDLGGNVFEYVADTYQVFDGSQPTDGSPVLGPGPMRPSGRGGAFYLGPNYAEAQTRQEFQDVPTTWVGVRIATSEICDGIDNDDDGVVDEGC